MTRVAAVDCGTNSIRLLVADVDPGRDRLADVIRRNEIVRLGQGVDRTGRLAPEALERTRAALAAYTAELRQLGARRVRLVATSATRDAENRDEFRDMVRTTLGVEPEVITGDEEAALSFAGAIRGLTGGEPPFLVLDIGGGSTELVLGGSAGTGTDAPVDAAYSMNIGCVRIYERHLHDDPPTPDQIARAEADVRAALDVARAAVPVEKARCLVGVAGTMTTVTAVALDLPRYDPSRVHHSRTSVARIREVADLLLHMPRAERATITTIHPGRVDVIGAGALILRVVMDEIGADSVVTSEHDILDGIAWSLA